MGTSLRAMAALLLLIAPLHSACAFSFVLQMTGRVGCYGDSPYPGNCPGFAAATGYGSDNPNGYGIGDFTARFVLDTDELGAPYGSDAVTYNGVTAVITAGSWTRVSPFSLRMFAQLSPIGNESCHLSGLPGTGLLFSVGTTGFWMSNCKRDASESDLAGGLTLDALATESLANFTGWSFPTAGLEGMVFGGDWRAVAFVDSIRRVPEPTSYWLTAFGLIGMALCRRAANSKRSAAGEGSY